MENTSERSNLIRVRAARGVRLVDEGGKVRAFPEPHRTPVLPAGWGPLSREQQNAVLEACKAAPHSMIVRLGSVWDLDAEYRVYRLPTDLWGGLSVITRMGKADGEAQLLGLALETAAAVRLVLDFFNWDLEAQGQEWRLKVATDAGR